MKRSRPNPFKGLFDAVTDFFDRRAFRESLEKERVKKYGRPSKPANEYQSPRQSVAFKSAYRFASTFYAKAENHKENLKGAGVAVSLMLLGLSGYVVLGSDYFRIVPSRVIIERLDFGSDVNVAYKSIEPFYGHSTFLVDRNEIARAITTMQGNIDRADVSVLYPNGLKIILSSRTPQFLTYFKDLERYYGITDNGILVYEKNKKADLPFLDIVDPALLEGGFIDYGVGVPKTKMEAIIRIRDSLKEVLPGLNPVKFAFFKLEQELHVILETGTHIVFSLDGSEVRQISALQFWNSQEQAALAKGGVSYVDLRIPTKIFVCREAQACRSNLIRIYGDYYRK